VEPKTTTDELKKNVQRLLEKHASGVMGRDLRRLYKEVGGAALQHILACCWELEAHSGDYMTCRLGLEVLRRVRPRF